MWMVKVESHREFWKCNANLLECGKCNLEFSCVPSFVPAGSGIGASRVSLLTDPKVTKYGPTPVSRATRTGAYSVIRGVGGHGYEANAPP